MKREVLKKRHLKLALVVGITAMLFGAVALPAAYAEIIKLTYASFVPAQTPPSVQAKRWADEVEKRTNGKVKVHLYPGGTLLNAKSMFQGVIVGQADIGVTVLASMPGRFPLISAIDLPVGTPSAKVGSRMIYDLYQKYKPETFSKVKVLAMFVCPAANIMSVDPIHNLEDLKGYPLRCTGAGASILKLLGANPVGMPMPETPEALQKGVVKGVSSSLEILKAFGFAETCRYATIANLQTASFSVTMNMDKWNSLPKEIQKIFDDLRVEQSEWAGNCFDEQVTDALSWSKEKYDLKVINLSKEERSRWFSLLEPIEKQWVKDATDKDVPAKEVLKDVMELKAHYTKMYGE